MPEDSRPKPLNGASEQKRDAPYDQTDHADETADTHGKVLLIGLFGGCDELLESHIRLPPVYIPTGDAGFGHVHVNVPMH